MPAAYVYGEKRELPDGFEDFFDPTRTAIISIDMHQGHLADTPDCPCPAPRAREIVSPIDAFHEQVRELAVPVIHVRSVLRKGGIDDAPAAAPPGAAFSRCMSARSPIPRNMRSRAHAGLNSSPMSRRTIFWSRPRNA